MFLVNEKCIYVYNLITLNYYAFFKYLQEISGELQKKRDVFDKVQFFID